MTTPHSFPNKRINTAFSLLAPVLLAAAAVAGAATVEQQRAAYKAARAAAHYGQHTVFETLSKKLRDYPLYPYLVYTDLHRRIGTANEAEIRDFLEQYADVPVSDRLRARWLEVLGSRKDWETFRAEYDPDLADEELRCYRLQADLADGQAVPFDADTQDLWLTPRSQADACDPIFAHWRSRGLLTDPVRLQRAAMAVRAGEYSLARYLVRGLEDAQRRRVEQWIAAFTRPGHALPGWRPAEEDLELVSASMKAVARSNSELAYRLWPDVQAAFGSKPDLAVAVQREMALFRATDFTPDAPGKLDALPAAATDQQIREWRVRLALAEGDWETVIRQIEAMDPVHSSRDQWRYWTARALGSVGRKADARKIYRELAEEPNYYGYLSADRIDSPYVLCPDPQGPDPQLKSRLEENPAVIRALELVAVDQPVDARREWRTLTRPLDEDERLAAALLAAEQGWHHQAILTLADIGRIRQYAARFPLVWPEPVLAVARQRNVPPSLIYGVMRSESALDPGAVSGAGARGLMQLTPSTARQIAKDTGMPRPTTTDLLDPEVSIAFGGAEIQRLYARFEHPLLVLAAYNAGPRPVDRWLDAGRLPTEPDRWIETLPYFETRDYLPRVLTFQSIYEWRLDGRMTRLEAMMLPLDERPGRPDWDQVPRTEPACVQASGDDQ